MSDGLDCDHRMCSWRPGESLPDGEAPPGPGARAAPARESDQDLVPEQESEAEEEQREQGRPGQVTGAAGLVQPSDDVDGRGLSVLGSVSV